MKLLSWIDRRHTKYTEDKAYSLLGILGIYMAPLYGEGMASAFRWLQGEINKIEKCIQDLHVTGPREDKKRIEDTDGGLREDSYCWILENTDFQGWHNIQSSRLLWIKGNSGKGKTMLRCGIINKLESVRSTSLLSYFFCQATDLRINNATAVLRGLVYMLVRQQPLLISHVRKKYDHADKGLFEGTNIWVSWVEILTDIFQDPNLNTTYVIIDALKECVIDLSKLLDHLKV